MSENHFLNDLPRKLLLKNNVFDLFCLQSHFYSDLNQSQFLHIILPLSLKKSTSAWRYVGVTFMYFTQSNDRS